MQNAVVVQKAEALEALHIPGTQVLPTCRWTVEWMNLMVNQNEHELHLYKVHGGGLEVALTRDWECGNDTLV